MGKNKVALNPTDREIINILYRNSTIKTPEIADRLSLTEDEAESSMKKVEQVIDRFPVIDAEKLGWGALAYIFVQCDESYNEAIQQTTKHTPFWEGVQTVSIVYGKNDIILRKMAPSESRIESFAVNGLELYERPSTYMSYHKPRMWGEDIKKDEQRGSKTVFDELTDLQKKVLMELQDDCTLKNKKGELSQRLAEDTGKVNDAIKILEERDIIRRYSISFDLESLGWSRAFLGISTTRGEYESVIEEIQKETSDTGTRKDILHVPFITAVMGVTWADIFVELRIESLDHLDKLTDEILSTDGVRSTRTFIEARNLHRDTSVPVN